MFVGGMYVGRREKEGGREEKRRRGTRDEEEVETKREVGRLEEEKTREEALEPSLGKITGLYSSCS